ncbi:hypothetical protein DV737_g3048, partial [Chaetothyriales sp. CBS 132003]
MPHTTKPMLAVAASGHMTIFALSQYTAVLSQEERVQRDLASHSLVADLPPSPFPHGAPKRARRLPAARSGRFGRADSDAGHGSLKAQHVAAMTALLHRCMQQRHYARASRALGLLLRTDVGGRPIDIRAAGYCQRAPFTRQGFADAQAFYETLIIQHPFHKPTPHSINALDFSLALFSLWIYVAQAEATQQQHALDAEQHADPSLDYLARLQHAKRGQLRQATEIADRLERCTSSAPFSSSQALLRMRAMLALNAAIFRTASSAKTVVESPSRLRHVRALFSGYGPFLSLVAL